MIEAMRTPWSFIMQSPIIFRLSIISDAVMLCTNAALTAERQAHIGWAWKDSNHR